MKRPGRFAADRGHDDAGVPVGVCGSGADVQEERSAGESSYADELETLVRTCWIAVWRRSTTAVVVRVVGIEEPHRARI